jgi:hypothetical protein
MHIDVRSYGAAGDGVTDDSSAIQAALDAAAETANGTYGGFVFLPKGLFRIGSQLVIPNGVGLLGSGPASTIIKALNTFNADSMITNQNKDGTQEYAFIESLAVDANKAAGAVCVTAAVDFVSLFINSYVRDTIIFNSSNVGLRIASASGMGPVLIENTWVIGNDGHNVLVEEVVGNTESSVGICFINLTSEHQASGKAAIYLKGLGFSYQWNFFSTHIEMANGGAGTRGVVIDGVGHVLFHGLQIHSGNTTGVKAVEITNAAQNVGIQLRGVTNINLIDPVLDDAKNNFTLGPVHIGEYITPDTHVIGTKTFENGVGAALGGLTPNIDLIDTTSTAEGVGSGIRFRGADVGTSTTSFAEIKAYKTNSISGDYSADLVLSTRENGSTLVAEALRLRHDASVVVKNRLHVPNEIAPAQITSNQDNYNPTGFSSAAVVILTSDASRDITGFVPSADGQLVWLFNNGAQNIVLKHNATSTATNRIIGRGGADTTLTPSTGALLYYSPSIDRWLVMSDTL